MCACLSATQLLPVVLHALLCCGRCQRHCGLHQLALLFTARGLHLGDTACLPSCRRAILRFGAMLAIAPLAHCVWCLKACHGWAARPADSNSSKLCHAHTCHPARWLWVTAASLPPPASCSSWLIFYQPSSSEWHAQPLTNRRRLNLEALGWCGTYTRPPHWC